MPKLPPTFGKHIYPTNLVFESFTTCNIAGIVNAIKNNIILRELWKSVTAHYASNRFNELSNVLFIFD